MNGTQRNNQLVLYLIACAAPPAGHIQEFIELAQAAQWNVCVIATPQSVRFINAAELSVLTGHMVRTDYKLPGEADPLPKADVILVFPATFNTINKWALGIGDTLATSILCECLGRGTPPIIVVPYLKPDLAHHPAFHKNIEFLRNEGVHILYDPEKYPSPTTVPWSVILAGLNRLYKKDS